MSTPPPPQNEETFHKARSRLIDSYARLEERVAKALDAAGMPIKGDTLASKLKTLRALPEKSKTELDRLSELVQFRADLVHSPMVLIDRDGERSASFRNARHAASEVQPTLQVSYRGLKDLADEIDRLSSMI
jgi:hypothetical protein